MSFDFDTLITHAEASIPSPGSSRDMVARSGEQETPASAAVPTTDNNPSFVVPVRHDIAEEVVTNTLLLSSNNPYLLMIPRDMRRSKAVVIAVTNPVYIVSNKSVASQIANNITSGNTAITSIGAYIPVNVSVPLEHRDQMWAVLSTTASTSPVAVIVERYAE